MFELNTHTECASFTRLVTDSAKAEFAGRSRTLRKNGEIALSTHLDRIYRLESGRLLLTTCNAAGEEVPLRQLSGGEFFGEFCYCSARNDQHDYVAVRALEPCELLEIRGGAFLRTLNRDPRALSSFVSSVCRHLAGADRRILALSHRDAERRVCLVLLELRAQAGRGEGVSSQVIASHAEIADFAAMSRPHVSVILGRLRVRGLVSYRRQGAIQIHQARVLRFLEQASEIVDFTAPRLI